MTCYCLLLPSLIDVIHWFLSLTVFQSCLLRRPSLGTVEQEGLLRALIIDEAFLGDYRDLPESVSFPVPCGTRDGCQRESLCHMAELDLRAAIYHCLQWSAKTDLC